MIGKVFFRMRGLHHWTISGIHMSHMCELLNLRFASSPDDNKVGEKNNSSTDFRLADDDNNQAHLKLHPLIFAFEVKFLFILLGLSSFPLSSAPSSSLQLGLWEFQFLFTPFSKKIFLHFSRENSTTLKTVRCCEEHKVLRREDEEYFSHPASSTTTAKEHGRWKSRAFKLTTMEGKKFAFLLFSLFYFTFNVRNISITQIRDGEIFDESSNPLYLFPSAAFFPSSWIQTFV